MEQQPSTSFSSCDRNVPFAQVILREDEQQVDEEQVTKLPVASSSGSSSSNSSNNTQALLLAPKDTAEHLRIAAATNDVQTVQLLLETWGSDSEVINEPDEHGKTAVWFAANYGHLRPLELLIAHGADVNEANNGGIGALYVAALGEHWACYELLERQNALIKPSWMAIFKPCRYCLPFSAAVCCPCLIMHTMCNFVARAAFDDSSSSRRRYVRPVPCDATGVAVGEMYC